MKRLIRRVVTVFLALAMAAAMSGCGNTAGAGGRSLTVFNYSEYMDPDMIKLFTEETGIEIKYEEALTAEDMYTKYKSGAVDYDLLCTCDYMLGRLINEGETREIPFDSFKNLGNIGQKYMDMSEAFDPGNKFTLPYFWGTIGILYDTSVVKEPVDSWSVLFDHSHAGDIIMQNSIRDTYMVALKYLGYSLNTTNENEIKEAQELLLAQKPDVQAYLVDEARDEVVAGNAAMAVVYSGEAYLGRQYNENLEYVVPKEGSNIWVDSWCITKNCKDVEAAALFLDFLCREDVASRNFEYIYYSTPNNAVIDSLSSEDRADTALVPPETVFDTCEICTQYDEETSRMYNGLWKELKSD